MNFMDLYLDSQKEQEVYESEIDINHRVFYKLTYNSKSISDVRTSIY